jgi:hypothetical protein
MASSIACSGELPIIGRSFSIPSSAIGHRLSPSSTRIGFPIAIRPASRFPSGCTNTTASSTIHTVLAMIPRRIF